MNGNKILMERGYRDGYYVLTLRCKIIGSMIRKDSGEWLVTVYGNKECPVDGCAQYRTWDTVDAMAILDMIFKTNREG
jgi:hypothetical protein